ncbi:hypothetical protein AMECASPLE_010591 [Ameca splendens]|uniref:Secreted protein n=1 Tax=Ameca splendens TaxID=208324 RepID=A0ABV0ZK94_9TELE
MRTVFGYFTFFLLDSAPQINTLKKPHLCQVFLSQTQTVLDTNFLNFYLQVALQSAVCKNQPPQRQFLRQGSLSDEPYHNLPFFFFPLKNGCTYTCTGVGQ